MQKKKSQVLLRLSEDEKKSFEMCAELSGISLSAWMRQRLRNLAVNELGNAGLVAPFIDDLVKEFRNA